MNLRVFLYRTSPLLWFLLLSIPHHPFSRWLDAEFIIPYGFESMQLAAGIGSAALALGMVVVAVVFVRRAGPDRWKHVGFWAFLLFSMVVVDRTLIINNIERIHYPQYALMSILLGLTIRNESLLLLAASFAGLADEVLQFAMNPEKTAYLDFNDIVLNILGAAFGTALVMAFRKREKQEPSEYEMRFRLGLSFSALTIVAIVLLADFTGRIIPVAEAGTKRSVIGSFDGKLSLILAFEQHPQFWEQSDYGKVFHVLSPWEGVILAGSLLVVLYLLIRWLKSSRNGASHACGTNEKVLVK